MNKRELSNKLNLKEYTELLAQREKLNLMYDSNSNEVNLGSLPKSMDEARSYFNFWQSFLKDLSENIEEITFNYQETKKQIPLTNLQKFRNYFGAKIKPKEIEGEIKECVTKPILISNEEGLAKIISSEEDWKKMNSLSKNTKDFYSTYVFTLEPLCYRTKVPLELITKMKLKGEKN